MLKKAGSRLQLFKGREKIICGHNLHASLLAPSSPSYDLPRSPIRMKVEISVLYLNFKFKNFFSSIFFYNYYRQIQYYDKN